MNVNVVRRSIRGIRCLVLALCGLALATTSEAKTYSVTPDGVGEQCLTNVLQSLIARGDTVLVGAGVYDICSTIEYKANCGETSILGEDGAILDGGGTVQILRTQANASDMVISNIVFRHAGANYSSTSAQNPGGALRVLGYDTKLIGCSFISCTNFSTHANAVGGAVYLNAGCSVVDCVFSNCFAYSSRGGGAARAFGIDAFGKRAGDVCYSGCRFYGNGIQVVDDCNGGAVNCAIYRDETDGAVYGSRFTNCVFSCNEGGMGGALAGDPLSVLDCQFVSNTGKGGGGVYVVGNAATYGVTNVFRQCAFTNNYAQTSAGGVWINGSAIVSFVACDFVGNSIGTGSTGSRKGAALCQRYGGTCTEQVFLDGCQFVNNRTLAGWDSLAHAGNCCYANIVVARNCLFEGNESDIGSMGMTTLSSEAVVERCAFVRNVGHALSTSGDSPCGALFMKNGGSVRDCLFDGNTNSTGVGAAILAGGNTANPVYVDNCTIVDNTCAGNAAVGAAAGVYAVKNGRAVMRNTYLAGNLVNATKKNVGCYNEHISGSGKADMQKGATNCVEDAAYITDVVDNHNVRNFADDPKFVDAASGNYALERRSPLVDKGIALAWMTPAIKDFYGENARFIGSAPDVGCAEFCPTWGFLLFVR